MLNKLHNYSCATTSNIKHFQTCIKLYRNVIYYYYFYLKKLLLLLLLLLLLIIIIKFEPWIPPPPPPGPNRACPTRACHQPQP